MVGWLGEKKSNGDRREAPYELKFSMCSTTSAGAASGVDSHNPHNLTCHFLELLINSHDTSLAQFMQVSVCVRVEVSVCGKTI